MKINIDLIIKPGKQEKYNKNGIKKLKVCEDYGIKSSENQIPMVVISDGCSSQDFSDWGSRILSLEYFNRLQRELKFYNDVHIFNENIHYYTHTFYAARKTIQFELNEMVLSATLSSLFIFNEHVYVNIINDGYLIIGYKNGQIEVNKFEYLLNAPYYLIYRFEKNLKRAYYKEFPDNKFIQAMTVFNNKDEFKIERVSYESRDLDYIFLKKYKMSDIDFVLIATDGINTFPKLEDNDFVQKLVDFKSLNGEFIQRRINRIFKDMENEKIYNFDDITIGGFSFMDE